MAEFWLWISDPNNQRTLAFCGTALATIAGFLRVYLLKPNKSPQNPNSGNPNYPVDGGPAAGSSVTEPKYSLDELRQLRELFKQQPGETEGNFLRPERAPERSNPAEMQKQVPSLHQQKLAHVANLLVCIAGLSTGAGPLAMAGSGVSGVLSLLSLSALLPPKAKTLEGKIATDLEARLKHLPEDTAVLIPQMIEKSLPDPSTIMDNAMDADRLCSAMIGSLTYDEHLLPDNTAAFRKVVCPILEKLLEDREFTDTLAPAFQKTVLQEMQAISGKLDVLLARSEETARQFSIKEGMLIGIARAYLKDNPDDFESALRGVEEALRAAAEETRRGTLPSNVDAAVAQVMAQVDSLNQEGRFTDARAELAAARKARREAMQAYHDEFAREQSGLIRVLDKSLVQARLENDPEMAAKMEWEKAGIEAQGAEPLFEAGRRVQDRYYEDGEREGRRFDLDVAIALAKRCVEVAAHPEERAMVQNDLGAALLRQGERTGGAEGNGLLAEAVTAYRDALTVYTQKAQPVEWATTQNNLGAALKTQGARTGGAEGNGLLAEAVTAYRAALTVYTQDTQPVDWARTKVNLALAEVALALHDSTRNPRPHLEAALAHVEAALTVFDPEHMSYDHDKAAQLRDGIRAVLDGLP